MEFSTATVQVVGPPGLETESQTEDEPLPQPPQSTGDNSPGSTTNQEDIPPISKVCNATMNNSEALPPKGRAMSLQDEKLLKASLRKVAGDTKPLETTLETSQDSLVDNREEIFEPRPSTSNSPSRKDMSGKRSMSLAVDSEDRRQRLLLMPRTTQYEKHPLLQDRSHSGLSELEAFLMEKEQCLEERVFSKNGGDHPGAPHQAQPSTSEPRLPLVPRGAHYETHALLVKKNSGITELEQYLMEKEQELTDQRRHSVGDTAATLANKDNVDSTQVAKDTEPRGAGERRESRLQLEPRSSQYQASALLESRDATGLSAIDHLLIAKAEEYDKGKCSARCTCKNAHCPNCKSSSGASSPRSPSTEVEADTTTRIEPKTISKHVHFRREGSDKAGKDEPPTNRDKEELQTGEGGEAGATEEDTQDKEANQNSSKIWKLGSGRKKKGKEVEGGNQTLSSNDSSKQNKAKTATGGHKHSCAIS